MRAQVVQHRLHLGVGLAQTQHEPGFGGHTGMTRREVAQQCQRPRVVGTGSCLAVEPRHRLEVVVEHIRRRLPEDVERALDTAAEVRHQHFHAGGWRGLADGSDAIGKVLRAAVAQVVAVDAGDHHIAQAERADRRRQLCRLIGVGRQRPAMGDVAEGAAPRADVAEDHEGRGATAETLADIGAARFFADRVQTTFTQRLPHLLKALAAGCTGTDPGRLWQRRLDCHDGDRVARRLAAAALLAASVQAHAATAALQASMRPAMASSSRGAQAATSCPQP